MSMDVNSFTTPSGSTPLAVRTSHLILHCLKKFNEKSLQAINLPKAGRRLQDVLIPDSMQEHDF